MVEGPTYNPLESLQTAPKEPEFEQSGNCLINIQLRKSQGAEESNPHVPATQLPVARSVVSYEMVQIQLSNV